MTFILVAFYIDVIYHQNANNAFWCYITSIQTVYKSFLTMLLIDYRFSKIVKLLHDIYVININIDIDIKIFVFIYLLYAFS